MRKHSAIGLMLLGLGMLAMPSVPFINATAMAASMVTADHKGGYSAFVMDEVLQYWTAPQGRTKEATRVLLLISGEGKLEECMVLSSSGSKRADKAVCDSAQKASPFVTPPHNLPMDVYMSFWTGKAVATGKKKTVMPQDSTDSAKSEPKASPEITPEIHEDAVRQEQERIIEEAQKPVAEQNSSKTKTSAQKAAQDAKKRAAEQASMVHAGIDYSRPRTTPAGLAPLGELVGAKLPKSDDTSEEQITPEQEKDVEKGTAATKDDFVITLNPAQEEEVSAESGDSEESELELDQKEKPDDLADVLAYAPAYTVGKEPFIQENRKGQIMDDNDYYVEKVIRQIRPLVVFPAQLKPGIVSAAVIMQITGSGKVQKVELSSTSYNTALDEALVTASKKITQLPPHPSRKPQELYLIFMVETPKP